MPEDRPTPANLTRISTDMGGFFARYFWLILRNVIGWLLILLALSVAGLIPLPLGTPLFLIGFALITFPGKRRLTARLLHGNQINLSSPRLRTTRAAISLLFPPLVIWLLARRQYSLIHPQRIGVAATAALYVMAIGGTWIGTLWLLRLLNLCIAFVPRIRRRMRPWMRRHGAKPPMPRKHRR